MIELITLFVFFQIKSFMIERSTALRLNIFSGDGCPGPILHLRVHLRRVRSQLRGSAGGHQRGPRSGSSESTRPGCAGRKIFMLLIGLDCGIRYRDLVSASDQTAHSQLESGSLGGGVLKGGADQSRGEGWQQSYAR